MDRADQYSWLVNMAASVQEETAVLYRNNDSALPLIDLLDRGGIPYRCRRMDDAFFHPPDRGGHPGHHRPGP